MLAVLVVFASLVLLPLSASASFWDNVILEGAASFRILDGVGIFQDHNFDISKPTWDSPYTTEDGQLLVHFPVADPYGYNLSSKNYFGRGFTIGYRFSRRVAIVFSGQSYSVKETVLKQTWTTDPNGPYADISGVLTQRGTYRSVDIELAVEFDLKWNGVFLTGGRRVHGHEYRHTVTNLWIRPTCQTETTPRDVEASCGNVMTMFGLGLARPLTRYGSVMTVVSYSFPTVWSGLQIRTGFRLNL